MFIIFSDVHGNLPALEALVEKTKDYAERYYCLGDTLGYGPWQLACLDEVFDLCEGRIALGRHDIAGILPESRAALSPIMQRMWEHAEVPEDHPLLRRLAKTAKFGIKEPGHGLEMMHHLIPEKRLPNAATVIVGHLETPHKQCSADVYGAISLRGRIYATGSVGMSKYALSHMEWLEFNPRTRFITMMSATYNADKYVRHLKAMNYPPAIEFHILNRATSWRAIGEPS